eukprot:NODE_261_length_12589_cov_0.423139.p8 type:complete len:116 gc:universal NODE_261_length_12589_cov_0.423139:6295-5948(-)
MMAKVISTQKSLAKRIYIIILLVTLFTAYTLPTTIIRPLLKDIFLVIASSQCFNKAIQATSNGANQLDCCSTSVSRKFCKICVLGCRKSLQVFKLLLICKQNSSRMTHKCTDDAI